MEDLISTVYRFRMGLTRHCVVVVLIFFYGMSAEVLTMGMGSLVHKMTRITHQHQNSFGYLNQSLSHTQGLLTVYGDRSSIRKAQGEFLSVSQWGASYYMDVFQLSSAQIAAPSSLNTPTHKVGVWTECGEDVDLIVSHHMKPISHILSGLKCHANASILHVVGDESCRTPGLFDVFPRFRLVTREYACWKQYAHLYRRHRNVLIIPLGYGTGMFGCLPHVEKPGYLPICTAGKSSLEVISNVHYDLMQIQSRKYAWSFVGGMKSDRPKALEAFKYINPHFIQIRPGTDHSKGKYSVVTAWADVLQNSSFSINGRGWVNLDCFRLYESTVNGAIPVVVGAREEIENTFGLFGSVPPWIFAKSWTRAGVIVEKFLTNHSAIRIRQNLLLNWWGGEVLRIREIVSNTLKGSQYVMPKLAPHTIRSS